jgi:hypothetical protein
MIPGKIKKGTKVKIAESTKVSSDYWGLEGRVIGHKKETKCKRTHKSNWEPVVVSIFLLNVVDFSGEEWDKRDCERGPIGLCKSLTLEEKHLIKK